MKNSFVAKGDTRHTSPLSGPLGRVCGRKGLPTFEIQVLLVALSPRPITVPRFHGGLMRGDTFLKKLW